MGRLNFRYVLSGTLIAESAVQILGVPTEGDFGLTHLKDGLGRVVLPGASLAGVVRAALPRRDDQAWWGMHESSQGGASTAIEDGHASRITVLDAPAIAETVLEVRDGVSIDRVTGAAAHRHLFTRYVVPAGTSFYFALTVDVPEVGLDDVARERAREIAGLLCGPGLTVGGGGTRGMGSMRLRDARLYRLDFTCAAGLFNALEGRTEPIQIPVVDVNAVPYGVLRITVPWRPLGAVMSRVADDTGNSDALPAVIRHHGAIRLLIPGSSIKGTLRSHAERIVRTVLDTTPLLDEQFGTQMKLAGGLPAVREIFGTASDIVNGDKGLRGSLTVHDVISEADVPELEWRRVRSQSDAATYGPGDVRAARAGAREAFASAVAALNVKTAEAGLWFDIASRNAIDRWSGSTAERLLFTALEPHAVACDPSTVWTPLILDLDIAGSRRRSTVSVDALLALTLLLLRDFAEGWIPIGSGTTRGLGSARADPTRIRFSYAGETGSDQAHALNGRSLCDVLNERSITAALDDAWTEVSSSPVSTATAD